MLAVCPSPLPFQTNAVLPFDDEGLDGTTSTEHSRDVSGDVTSEEDNEELKKQTKTTLVDGDDESEYTPSDEDESDVDSDEDDDEHHLLSMDQQLDEHADEVGDYYLRRMLEKRALLEGEEAAWVDSYIERQRQWKEKYGTSIDEMDLDLLEPRTTTIHPLYGRVLSSFPPAWPTEYVGSFVAVGLFVILAITVQFYVAFKPSM